MAEHVSLLSDLDFPAFRVTSFHQLSPNRIPYSTRTPLHLAGNSSECAIEYLPTNVAAANGSSLRVTLDASVTPLESVTKVVYWAETRHDSVPFFHDVTTMPYDPALDSTDESPQSI